VTMNVTLSSRPTPTWEQLPDNGQLVWNVAMPARVPDKPDKAYEVRLAGMAIEAIGQATSLPMGAFKPLVERSIERGLPGKVFSVRHIRELMKFVHPDELKVEDLGRLPVVDFKNVVHPIEYPELAWRSSLGPGYSPSKAEEFLKNRYSVPMRALALSLPRIAADERCMAIVQNFRSKGYLDWQILAVLLGIVVQWQVQQALGPKASLKEVSKRTNERIYQDEITSDPEFDLVVLDLEFMEIHAQLHVAAAFKTWDLAIHRSSPDFDAMKRLLDVRYRHSLDDIPHNDPFVPNDIAPAS